MIINRNFEIGDKVKIISQGSLSSILPEIGIVTEIQDNNGFPNETGEPYYILADFGPYKGISFYPSDLLPIKNIIEDE